MEASRLNGPCGSIWSVKRLQFHVPGKSFSEPSLAVMGFLTRSHKNYTRCEEFFNSWKTAVSFQVEKIESVRKGSPDKGPVKIYKSAGERRVSKSCGCLSGYNRSPGWLLTPHSETCCPRLLVILTSMAYVSLSMLMTHLFPPSPHHYTALRPWNIPNV